MGIVVDEKNKAGKMEYVELSSVGTFVGGELGKLKFTLVMGIDRWSISVGCIAPQPKI